MSRSRRARFRDALWLFVFGGTLTAITLLVLSGASAGATAPGGALTTEPVLKSAAAGAERVFGATPAEAPGEVWGISMKGPVRYTDAGGWERLPLPVGADGQPLVAVNGVDGRTTSAGGAVIAAEPVEASGARRALLIRSPGGEFSLTPAPEIEGEGEGPGEEEGGGVEAEPPETAFSQLFVTPAPAFAAVEEPGGVTGAFSVPPSEPAAPQDKVLHFDGSTWSEESICMTVLPTCTAPRPAFRVLAVEATGPGNAWLLGEGGSLEDGLELFEREGGLWVKQKLGGPGSAGAFFAENSPEIGITVAPRSAQAQPLTVTANGVWLDANVRERSETFPATLYFGEGTVQHCWSNATRRNATPVCESPLEPELSEGPSRSFAWPATPTEPFGRRVITGVSGSAIFSLAGATFERIGLGGAATGGFYGSAFQGPEEGWLGSAKGPLRITRAPARSTLAAWPVPFRRPLTAIAAKPGTEPGSLGSEALAVGDQGQVARYIPGQGWAAESLLNSAGVKQTPRLRAVAWPEAGTAYAVGDGGAMWLWRAGTGLWEPDPGAPSNLIRGNFTSIAFDPAEPARGYAVGKQGLLLAYGREWTQESLPAEIPPEANLTSVAFAGGEALAAWRYPLPTTGRYIGGLIANDGSGWKVVPDLGSTEIPILASGLPDGGATIAFEGGEVMERNGPGAPWAPTPEAAGGYPVAMQAFRESGLVRAIVSVWPETGFGVGWNTDREQALSQPPVGQAPLLTEPYPPASRGYLERQTPTGWRDEQHESFPVPEDTSLTGEVDLPREPDPLLAMLISADGSGGWVVGGETGSRAVFDSKSVQTASVMRYGTGAAPPANFHEVPITASTGATFAIGGGAECASACADQAGAGIGPEVWLPAAVSRAASIPGVRAFLYSGPGVARSPEEAVDPASRLGSRLSVGGFAREEAAYAGRLRSGSATLPVYPAPTPSDRDRAGSLATFASAFAPVTGLPEADLSRGYYDFDSTGVGSTVRVIVLDYAEPTLGSTQDCWLAEQLAGARSAGVPAIVLGGRDLGGLAEAPPADALETIEIMAIGTSAALVAAGCAPSSPAAASAYFFDFHEGNRAYRLSAGGASVPAYGSGTLGFVETQEGVTDFVGAGGFLLATVGAVDPLTNVAPVSVRLIPNIGGLALEAVDGTLLRRSSVALFRGLARRPLAGSSCAGQSLGGCQQLSPDPYVPIPSTCQGADCATGVFPEYRFSSSDPTVANFVAVDPASSNPRSVLLGSNGKPTADPTSGLLCTFNAGTTTVSIEAGGLAYSTTVTVQKGSVQRPCGTVPVTSTTEPVTVPNPVPPPTTTQTPHFKQPSGALPPPPVPSPLPVVTPPTVTPTTPQVVHVPPPPPISLPNFFTATPTLAPIVPIVPPPPPPAVEPTPPSGTSPVTQPAFSPEPEEEEEAAFDLVHHAVAVRHGRRSAAANAAYPVGSGSGPGMWVIYALPTLVVIAALSSYGIAGRRGRRQPEPAFLRPPR
jgi:hypothetical protein